MPNLAINKRADPAYIAAFSILIKRLVSSTGGTSNEPIKMYLAGGAAMHFYTGSRISDDIDAVFSRKLLIPSDLTVIYRDSEDRARSVFFDTTYNEAFALLHEDAHGEAWYLPLDGIEGAQVFVLQPVDLAVSKLARFAEVDRKDILELASEGLITSQALRQRAEAALPGYVGNPTPVRTSIDIACRNIEALDHVNKPVDK